MTTTIDNPEYRAKVEEQVANMPIERLIARACTASVNVLTDLGALAHIADCARLAGTEVSPETVEFARQFALIAAKRLVATLERNVEEVLKLQREGEELQVFTKAIATSSSRRNGKPEAAN